MKKLVTRDVFSMVRLITSLDIKKDIEEMCRNADSFDDFGNGFQIFYLIFEKATTNESEDRIYEFLSHPFEMDKEEIANLPLDELMEMLQQLTKENDLKVFIKNVKGLLGIAK